MQQRVAIARALVSRPEILLLDEPFASVDALTRAELQDLVLRLHQHEEKGVTIVHVTHDIDEAVYLADRVLVLSGTPGRIVASVDVPCRDLASRRRPAARRSSFRFATSSTRSSPRASRYNPAPSDPPGTHRRLPCGCSVCAPGRSGRRWSCRRSRSRSWRPSLPPP